MGYWRGYLSLLADDWEFQALGIYLHLTVQMEYGGVECVVAVGNWKLN